MQQLKQNQIGYLYKKRPRGISISIEAAQSGIGLRGAVEVKGRIGIGQD